MFESEWGQNWGSCTVCMRVSMVLCVLCVKDYFPQSGVLAEGTLRRVSRKHVLWIASRICVCLCVIVYRGRWRDEIVKASLDCHLYVHKVFCVWVGRAENKAKQISRSLTFALCIEFSETPYFEWKNRIPFQPIQTQSTLYTCVCLCRWNLYIISCRRIVQAYSSCTDLEHLHSNCRKSWLKYLTLQTTSHPCTDSMECLEHLPDIPIPVSGPVIKGLQSVHIRTEHPNQWQNSLLDKALAAIKYQEVVLFAVSADEVDTLLYL